MSLSAHAFGFFGGWVRLSFPFAMGKKRRKTIRIPPGIPNPIKGMTHNRYSAANRRAIAASCFARFEDMDEAEKYGFLSRLADESGVPRTTLSGWKVRHDTDPLWRPWNSEWGQHLRIFTDDEEANMVEFITANYLDHGLLFTDEDFRVLAIDFYQEKWHDIDWETANFVCSRGFIHDFKERNDLTSRRGHFERRSQVTEGAKVEWTDRMKRLLETMNWIES
jgi:hypothetical protein